MKQIRRTVWLIAGILSPVPGLLFYFWGNFYDILEPYSLGMVFGIIGYIYFANVLIISARIRFFDRIFGHDRVLLYHGYTAFTALLFSLIHVQLKSLVFGDLSFFQPRIGQVALIIFFFVIAVTILLMVPGMIHRLPAIERMRLAVTKRPWFDYNMLRRLHNVLAAAFALLLVHVLLASSSQENWGSLSLAGLWGATAILLWIFHKVIRPLVLRLRKHTVERVIRHSSAVTEIQMSREKWEPREHKAGQFVFARFPGSSVGGEEHSFTLSSGTGEDFLSITAKDLGNYTSKLHLLKEGDTALLDGPYGIFTLDPGAPGPFLFIAGGIGITPLYSILKSIPLDDPREIFLFWAVRKREDLAYDTEIRDITGKHESISYIPVLSDEEPREGEEKGFISAELLEKYCGNISGYTVYFCGPPVMRRLVFRILKDKGVKKTRIRHEMFSLG